MINLNGKATPSQVVEKPRPPYNGPKSHIKTLESVHIDEVGNIGTKNSTRQDGGDEDNSNLGNVNYINVSHGCELNLSSKFEPTSFEEVSSHD